MSVVPIIKDNINYTNDNSIGLKYNFATKKQQEDTRKTLLDEIKDPYLNKIQTGDSNMDGSLGKMLGYTPNIEWAFKGLNINQKEQRTRTVGLNEIVGGMFKKDGNYINTDDVPVSEFIAVKDTKDVKVREDDPNEANRQNGPNV